MRRRMTLFVAVFVLAVCGAFFAACSSTGEPQTEHTHSYGEWTETTPATCTEKGERTRTCSCGESETEDIDPLGHAYGAWEPTVPAQCESEGLDSRECSRCHNVETEKVEATGHDWSAFRTVKDATCNEAGLKYRVCLDCDERDDQVIPVDESKHVFGAYTVVTPSTCTVKGRREHTCSICERTVDEEIELDPDNHSFVADSAASSLSTCTVAGKSVKTCEDCGEHREEILPLDTYAHEHYDSGKGICADCGGLLESSFIIDNSTGKAINEHKVFLEGDFEAVFEFDTEMIDKSDANWHNFIMTIGAADAIGGKIYPVGPSHRFIPFHPGDNIYINDGENTGVLAIDWHYGSYWRLTEGKYSIDNWIFKDDGSDPGFGEIMKLGAHVTMTVKAVGGLVTFTIHMESKEDGYTSFDSHGTMKFPGAEKFCLALSGEKNKDLVKQITLKSGKLFTAAAEPASTALTPSQEVYTNIGKNAEGINYALDGEFDIYFDLKMNNTEAVGAADREWHNWKVYFYEGVTDKWSDQTRPDNPAVWSFASTGYMPDNWLKYYPTVKDKFDRVQTLDGTWVALDFDASAHRLGDLLANADILMHAKRTANGIIYVNVVALKDGVCFARYGYNTVTPLTGAVTMRITSEKSAFTVESVRLAAGERKHLDIRKEITQASTCTATGLCDVYCGVCGEKLRTGDTVPVDPDNHVGLDALTWTTVEEPSCKDGEEEATCACGETLSRPIPATGEHAWQADPDSDIAVTCVAEGRANSQKCKHCDTEKFDTIPVNIYAHAHMTKGVCDACHGILSELRTLDNSGGAKMKPDQTEAHIFEGDFTVKYEMEHIPASDGAVAYNGQWHTPLVEVGFADRIDGVPTKINTSHTVAMFPWGYQVEPGKQPGEQLYGTYWVKSGCTESTESWFLGPNGEDPGFAVCMAGGANVTVTLTNRNGIVTVTKEMTDKVYGYTYRGTMSLNFGGARMLYVGASGENNIVKLKQITVGAGKLAESGAPQGKQLLSENYVIDNKNGSKNVEALSYKLDGDFELDVELEMDSYNPDSDWHSFIFYIMNGESDSAVVEEGNLLWSGTANGAEPDHCGLWHDLDFGGFWRRDTGNVGNFANALATAKVQLHITRKDGYITVTGAAKTADGATVITYYAFASMSKIEGKIRVRLTSENSKATFTSAKLISGSLAQ